MSKLCLETKKIYLGGLGGPRGANIGVKWDFYRYPIFAFSKLLKLFFAGISFLWSLKNVLKHWLEAKHSH